MAGNKSSESKRNKPRKGKKHTYTDSKERKKNRLDAAFEYETNSKRKKKKKGK